MVLSFTAGLCAVNQLLVDQWDKWFHSSAYFYSIFVFSRSSKPACGSDVEWAEISTNPQRIANFPDQWEWLRVRPPAKHKIRTRSGSDWPNAQVPESFYCL